MKVTVNCSKCKEELEIKYACVTSLTNLVLEVTPCANTACYNCSECEQAKTKGKTGTEKAEQRYKPKSKAHANVNVPKCPQSGKIFGRSWKSLRRCSGCPLEDKCKKEYFDKYEEPDDDDEE